ncbi:MAG: DUF3991 domain-containing protein [bacterium]|nr:DUF3991 domain-containing protein [bacterium]
MRDEQDNGSIIDFVQNRRSLNLGEVRQVLRPWIGQGAAPWRPPEGSYARRVEPSTKDRARVAAEYAGMEEAKRHGYLEQERKLPAAVLCEERFAGRIRIDGRGNAVFPHFDEKGLCGYELKNRNFTGFSRGGEKGLWVSVTRSGDSRLVIGESAIDALSYHVLHPDRGTRYASIGGQLNPKQPCLIRAAVEEMRAGTEVISAMDADEEGRKLGSVVRQAVEATGRQDLSFRHDEPVSGKDWNDVLRREAGRSRSVSFPTAHC